MSVSAMSTSLLLGLTLLSSSLSAACPRTGGEKARRIVPAVLLFPYALPVLFREQSRVAMPAAGTRVRVSHDTPDGMRFTEGAFVSMRDSTFQLLITDHDTAAFPLAATHCLQVYRQSRWIGAGVGFVTGISTGMLAGAAVGAANGDASESFFFMLVGGAVGEAVGSIIGFIHGASAWDVAWERSRP